jgi:hypothetical protein
MSLAPLLEPLQRSRCMPWPWAAFALGVVQFAASVPGRIMHAAVFGD